MAVAVEILLDAAGIPSLATATHGCHRPHVTLLNATALSITDPLIETLRPLLGTELRFDSLAIFPGTSAVLFLAARVTQPLLDVHVALHQLVTAERTQRWSHYLPGAWIPHCTLAGGLDTKTTSRTFGLLHQFRSTRAEIAEICAVDTETGYHARLIAV